MGVCDSSCATGHHRARQPPARLYTQVGGEAPFHFHQHNKHAREEPPTCPSPSPRGGRPSIKPGPQPRAGGPPTAPLLPLRQGNARNGGPNLRQGPDRCELPTKELSAQHRHSTPLPRGSPQPPTAPDRGRMRLAPPPIHDFPHAVLRPPRSKPGRRSRRRLAWWRPRLAQASRGPEARAGRPRPQHRRTGPGHRALRRRGSDQACNLEDAIAQACVKRRAPRAKSPPLTPHVDHRLRRALSTHLSPTPRGQAAWEHKAGAPGEAGHGKERTTPPESYRKVARRASRTVTLGEPGDLRSCPRAVHKLLLERSGPRSTKSGRFGPCAGTLPQTGDV